MILSMTGYASQELNTANGTIIVELRSVNHRYLELQLKLDDNMRFFESSARECVQAKLGRGKVDCRISLKQDYSTTQTGVVNHVVLQQIAENMEAAGQYFKNVQAVNLLEVIRMPGVLQAEKTDMDALEHALKEVLNLVLDQLVTARQREGEKLKLVILERLNEIETLVIKVKPLLPALIKAYQEKLTLKLQEAMVGDDERVRQEVVLYAQRIDVDEELSRLDAHIGEVRHILTTGGSVGKKLDFLMQEMNREANTLGSKSVAIETTQISMQLKVLIEQMREQIQNLE
ncbi:MAG: YicC/YloC family endoribonuclease [Methylophilus sp.]|nr:YicC/YloC family endoribonuclease [Methylophilus sp.]